MNQKELLKNLQKFGFLPQQAKLYLAGIQSGPSLMMPLANKAGIKRTTAIYCMRELLRRKFFSTVKIGKRTGYKAISANGLLKITKKRELMIKKILPNLNKLSKTAT